MVAVFPRMTKCTFHKYGASGSLQKHDALCVLALNILNEKIYIFLWFWLIVLAVMSGIVLLYSSALVVLPSVRELVLKWHFRVSSPSGVSILTRKTQVNKCNCNLWHELSTSINIINFFFPKFQIGDFLLLHLLSQNMNMMVYGEVLNELCNKMYNGNNLPTAPSTLELSPIYPSEKLSKMGRETEA